MDSLFYSEIERLGHFSLEQIDIVIKAASSKEITKKEVLLSRGEICDRFYFVERGKLYQYETNAEMEEIVIDLHIAKDWVLEAQSFTSRKPSNYSIVAYDDSLIYELHIDAVHQLILEYPVFIQLGKILGEASKRIDFLDKQLSPDEKYQYLLDHRPALIQNFPQYMIASFLKITPETLSRVRKRFVS